MKIPARYTGLMAVSLVAGLGPYFNGDGSQRSSLTLNPGDEIMMEAADIIGKTILYDPAGGKDPLSLGVGHIVLPRHASLTREKLTALGYEFHAGRSDFEEIIAPAQE